MKTRLMFLSLVVVAVRASAQQPPSEPPMVTDEQGDLQQQPVDGDGAEQQQGDDSYGYVEGQPDEQQQQQQPQQQPQQQYAQQPQYNEPPAEDAEPVQMNTVNSVQAFEPSLAPYGDWVATNGQRAWRPSPAVVGNDFVPYASSGQWVSTEAGWSFASTLPFGWATFHYGRWWFDPSYGWVWLPDTTWGPSWVEWRYGGGYAGWAPLAPMAFASYYRPRWYFVPSTYMCSRDLYRYAVPYSRYSSIYGVTVGMPTRYYRGVTWHVGPNYHEVARVAYERPMRRSMVTFGQPTHVAVNGGYRQGSGGTYGGNYGYGNRNGNGYHPASPPPPSGGVVHGAPSGNYGGYGGYNHGSPPPPANGGFSPSAHGSYTPPPSHGGSYGGGGYTSPPSTHYSSPAPHYSPPAPSTHYSSPAPSHTSSPAPSHSSSGGSSGAHRH